MEIQSVIAAAVGLLAGIGGAFAKDYFSLRVKSDESLRQQRLSSYIKLWSLTGVTPKSPKDEAVTYDVLQHTAERLRNWYYTEGGLVLSRRSQKAYENLQEKLRQVVSKAKADPSRQYCSVVKADAESKTNDYLAVHAAASTLRTALTDDLQSRNRHPWSRPFNKAEERAARHWVIRNTERVLESSDIEGP